MQSKESLTNYGVPLICSDSPTFRVNSAGSILELRYTCRLFSAAAIRVEWKSTHNTKPMAQIDG